MLELFTTYTISEIITFLIAIALAVKGFVSFWDWAIDRLRKVFNKENRQKEEKEILEERLVSGYQKMKYLEETQKKNIEHLQNISNQIEILINSDKDSIKAWITEKHHFYCYKQKWIDDYSLDCIEKRFSIYQKENGNSFVEGLMEDIRKLPQQPLS